MTLLRSTLVRILFEFCQNSDSILSNGGLGDERVQELCQVRSAYRYLFFTLQIGVGHFD